MNFIRWTTNDYHGIDSTLRRGKMTSKFEQKINTVEWLLTDGATGTNLFDMGLMSGDAPELWNEKYPEKIANFTKIRLMLEVIYF